MPESVDQTWADGVLEQWIDLAERALVPAGPASTFCESSVATRQLAEWEPRAQRVVQVILQLLEPPQLMFYMPGPYDYIELRDGIALARRALAVLRTAEETERFVTGTTAPVMSADALHPRIWDAAAKLWRDGHHLHAVSEAAGILNVHVQGLVGRTDVSDGQLMSETFSLGEPQPGKPRLRWPGDDNDQTVKSMRTGLLQFSQGCYSAIRNPAAHGTAAVSEQVALEQLAALSALARWIDQCEVLLTSAT